MAERNARTLALSALLEMERAGGYSNLVLDGALRAAGLEAREAALAAAIFYGVIEKRLTLDWLIQRCLRDPDRRMDRTVRMALRCGAYQIWFMDRVPDSAAVNETVNAVKAGEKRALAGFVNGVLRSLSRQKESLSLPEGDSPEAQSERWSVPEPLIRFWRKHYGKPWTDRLLEDFSRRAPTWIRVNARRCSPEALAAALAEEGAAMQPHPALAGAARLDWAGSPAALSAFAQGMFHVQDLSAQLVCAALDVQPGERVYDCCAAPGGKSFTLAQQLGESGQVTALELYPARVGLIQSGAGRLGLKNVTALQADMTAPPRDLPPGDRVLCDAPCSGYGVIRRKPEIRYRPLDEARALPELQLRILHGAAGLVRPGGVLVYSTCTLDPAENGRVAERFLAEHPDFSPAPLALPGVDRTLEEPEAQLTLTPANGGSDGFFLAKFRRRG